MWMGMIRSSCRHDQPSGADERGFPDVEDDASL